MIRSRRVRLGFALLAAALPASVLVAVGAALSAPREKSFDFSLLAPSAYLAVAVLAVLAPLFAGGGNELFPMEQLSAFPISARTQFVASLALTPLNLAWVSQVVALLGLTAYIAGPKLYLPLALLTCLAYVAATTVLGQVLGWAVIGIRHTQAGRRLTTGFAALVVAGAAGLMLTGNVTAVLDRSPLQRIVSAALAGANGQLRLWGIRTGLLLALAVLAYRAGPAVCAWAVRRPSDPSLRVLGGSVRRRRQTAHPHREVLAIDRRSVWRSPSLRRGLAVLGLLPGAVAAAAGLQWSSLILLPGLVAAGAGLLFGVNAFCLDGSGAVWLASLPRHHDVAYWSKVRVVAETSLVAVVLTVMAGSLRSGRLPTATEFAALITCSVVTLLWVVSTCLRLSIDRPHRADLIGPRDTPAPPGVMAVYSARLAVATTLIAVLFSATAQVASALWPAVLAVPFLALGAARLRHSERRWRDPAVRSQVVSTVASG